ncbi:UNVERIFIED_CONTAM: hypothetical protein Sradi_0974500 [Sesamum radiatum]|uniref:Uncharacterized protein n=1 Tax=Sesamum radiatum TaxID=300843 RepID=A0AAW2V7E9_SESRA
MKEYRVPEFWTRPLVVTQEGRLRIEYPVRFTGNGKIVVQWPSGACLYDPSLKRWEKFDMETNFYKTYKFFVGESGFGYAAAPVPEMATAFSTWEVSQEIFQVFLVLRVVTTEVSQLFIVSNWANCNLST